MPPEHPQQPVRVAIRIALFYVISGAAWILFTDYLLKRLVRNESLLLWFATFKGWFFVGVTGWLLYRIVLKPMKEAQQAQERLHCSAYRDEMTGLPNRPALQEAFTRFAKARPRGKSGLLFLDLDKFKYVNDCLGHSIGDKLLQALGARMADRLGGSCRIYRFGGDEFVLWPAVWEGERTLERLAETVLELLEEPFSLDGSNLRMTASIGGAYYPCHGEGIEALLRCGDMAMHKAKSKGGQVFVLFEPAMNEAYRTRMELEAQLRTALEHGEFHVAYQPRYDIRSRRIAGFEALLRWNSPQLGPVPPDRFIPVAEDTRMIVPIGEWVIRNACGFASRLRRQSGQDLAVSVNISIVQIMQDSFEESVRNALRDSGLPHHALELEITESVFMESLELVNRKLGALRAEGIRVALDDFGKGYSSLNSLMHLPITTIKLDKSFLESICSDPKHQALVRHIIGIGRTFGLEVVAEGVEHPEQARLLEANRCHLVQGYLFGRPVPESEALLLPGLRPEAEDRGGRLQ